MQRHILVQNVADLALSRKIAGMKTFGKRSQDSASNAAYGGIGPPLDLHGRVASKGQVAESNVRDDAVAPRAVGDAADRRPVSVLEHHILDQDVGRVCQRYPQICPQICQTMAKCP